MERESGFYRVKRDGEWTIGEWSLEHSNWLVIGLGMDLYEDQLDEVDDERISMPA